MPELPEVEVIRRNVEGWCVGRPVVSVRLADPAVVRQGAVEELVGASLVAARRRGKFLLLDFDTELTAIFHFRMTGKLVRLASAEDVRVRRLTLGFGGGILVAMVDTRRLGHIEVVSRAQAGTSGLLAELGPEPWPAPLSGEAFAARFAGCAQPIKAALLDPRRIAGVGNILASEACWEAEVDPRRAASTLTPDEHARLAEALCEVCDRVIEAEQSGEVHYVNEGARADVSYFRLYKKDQAPCPRCGAPIERMTSSGRVTFWCPSCQR